MRLMPLCINLISHDIHHLVYSILLNQMSTSFALEEDNDQAFSIAI